MFHLSVAPLYVYMEVARVFIICGVCCIRCMCMQHGSYIYSVYIYMNSEIVCMFNSAFVLCAEFVFIFVLNSACACVEFFFCLSVYMIYFFELLTI